MNEIMDGVFPNVISRENRVSLLKAGYSGKDIERMAVYIAGYQVTVMA